ncbi:chaplin [Streptomyces lunaelactis]|uniref:chaplin n=1 Tax=Streptomyces lunaelactis TaxID=1535768 RepID=UPI001584C047|nr:chaplin [Streptomyces lunaelactis]NUK74282.1 chaplin [Streptomyces lunaelactis]NUK76498.1 chaplin [Streptomyces lunaelactis]
MKHKKAAVVIAGVLMSLGSAAPAMADAGADAIATDSAGVLSGNVFQLPIHIPVNACGNTLGVIGLLSPAFGNACSNV